MSWRPLKVKKCLNLEERNQKVLKTGQMLNMFVQSFWGIFKKVLITGEMFHMFNSEEKLSCSIPVQSFPPELNILSILNISPVLSTFLNMTKKIEHIEHFPLFKRFLMFIL